MESTVTESRNTSISRRGAVLALLAMVVLIALPIRLYLATAATMVSRDGVVFIWYAQGLASDPIAEMRRQAQHPLYPAMVLAGHKVVGAVQWLLGPESVLADPVVSWPAAGVGVTLLAGLAVVIAIYVLTATLFDRRVGLMAAALVAAAAEFCQFSADALTDMPHLAVYLFGLAAAIHGMKRGQVRWLFAAGLLSGAAYLIRPEGAEVAVATVPVMAFFARDWQPRRRLIAVVVLALGAAISASPYMVVTGKLVQKKSIGRFLGGDEEAACGPGSPGGLTRPSSDREGAVILCGSGVLAPSRSRLGSVVSTPSRTRLVKAGASAEAKQVPVPILAVARIGEYWCRALRVTFMLPVMVWLVRRRQMPADPIGARLVAAALSLHLAILVALIVQFDYLRLFSLRHVIVPAALTLPFAAAGIEILLRAAGRRQAKAGALLAILMIAPTLPWMLERPHGERAYLRRAADWIRQQGVGHPPRVLTTRHRVAFYAAGVYLRSPLEPDAGWILAEARANRADWLVFDEQLMLRQDASFFEELHKAIGPGERLELAYVESQPAGQVTNRVLVYGYRPPP